MPAACGFAVLAAKPQAAIKVLYALSPPFTLSPMNQPTQSQSGLARRLGPVMATASLSAPSSARASSRSRAASPRRCPTPAWSPCLWILGGVLVVLGALAYAEVAILLPRAGGNYVFCVRATAGCFGFLLGLGRVLDHPHRLHRRPRHHLRRDRSTTFSRVLASRGRSTSGRDRSSPSSSSIVALAAVNVPRRPAGAADCRCSSPSSRSASLLAILALPFVALRRDDALDARRRSRPVADVAGRLDVAVNSAASAPAFLGVLWAYHGWMKSPPSRRRSTAAAQHAAGAAPRRRRDRVPLPRCQPRVLLVIPGSEMTARQGEDAPWRPDLPAIARPDRRATGLGGDHDVRSSAR